MAEQNINTNITATANFSSLTAQLRAVTAELVKLQATTIGLDRNLSNEVGRMNRSFAETMRATGQFSSHFVTLESDVQKFGKRLDTGRMKLGEYFGVWQGHTRKTSTLIKDLAKQQVLMEQAVLQPLGRNAQGQMQYNVHVANGLDLLKNRTALLRQEASILNKVMLDGSNQLINWGKNTQWAGRQLTVGLTVPMMAFGAAAQKAFLEADQQLVRLTKVYGGLAETSSAELKQVRKDVEETAKELASIYGASYKETIALAADIAATGKQGNDLLVSTQETTRLSILGEVDRQDAMKATLAIQNAFKQSNDELAQSINFLNAVENQTSTSLADLVEAIPKAGPVIESLGGNVQDLALYLTAMKEGGVNASEGANAIKSSLASLINPTKVAKEMFMGFGIDLGSIVKSNAGDVTATILALQASLDKLDPLQKAQAIEQLFGKFQFARMGALFNNLGKEGSQTLQVLDLMKASTEELASIADRELKAMTESASGQYKRALETIKAELAGVGDQFLKISTFVLKTISGIIKFVENLPGPIKSLLTFLGGLTAFAGPLIMLTGVLGNFLGYIIKGVFHLKQLFKGGSGFKLLTPEMMAAAEAGKVVEKSFFSDAQAAIALETAVNNLAASFDRLKASALNSAVATSSSISTMGGATVLSPTGVAANAERMADKDSKFIGAPYSRQFAHTIPAAIQQPGTIFGVVPNPGPVNVRVSNNPQMYMDQDLPRVPGVTSISGVSTGIVAAEAAKWHAMTAAIATQSQAELSLLKTEVAATGTVTHELSSVYQAMLPQMQQLTQLAADEGAMIVRQLQQGVITVDQARAKIISLNATIEVMMAETAAQVAAGMGRGINLTTVPFTSQPVVDPVTGKSNMKEMFHKPETAALVDKVAEGLGVRTSGGGYSIETTKPRIILPKRGPLRGFNDGGYVYTLEDGPVVPGDKSVNYDNTMAKIPVGGFVLNQDATRNNPQLVEYAKKSKPYNRGGMIDAMLTPYETVFTPEQTQEMLPILEAANNGQRIQFRNAGGILGGPIVSGKHNYGRFDALKSLFKRKKAKSADDLANLSPQIRLGREHRTDADDAHDYVEGVFGAAAPRRGVLGNKNGYFFVGNWGLNTRKTTNSKINAGTAKPQEIIDDIMFLPPSEALPALRRFLKVNKIDDELADRLVLEARDGIVSNLASHGDSLIGERLFAQAQHAEYLKIADQLGLRKRYIDSLNVPGQRRGFKDPGNHSSGFQGATAISPYRTSDLDTLITKNEEFGTNFMGSYETYNPKELKINGEDGAFAHMMLDGFAMGGIIKKRKANYGRLFLGMPKSIKQVQEQRKRREVMEQTTEAVNKSRFAKEEPTNFGKKEEDTKGHSFPVEGVGGVYTKPDGTRVFVKPVLDETAALAEQRYNAIHQGAHRLTPPQQEIRVMIDPTDPAGKRKLLVLESPYDPRFASLPKEMSEQEYFQQLLASALRGDKDLSPGNIGGSFVADGGTMGVFKTASGLRSYADDMPSVAEQARINLLGVKGGAKRFFAESTVDIPRGMTPQQYQQSMLNEIDEVLPRLKETIAGFKGLTPREEEVYAAMIKRLEDARHVNWKEFHGIHSAVKPTAPKSLTPAALAKLEEAAALRARQKGHAVSLSDMAFKSDANGFNGGGLINVIKSLAMRRIGAGFGKNTTGGWGVTSLEIGMAEKLFASSGLTKRTQRILYDKFAEALAKEMPYGYAKNAQGQLLKALEPDIMDSVIRSAASSTISAPEGRRVLSAIDRDILKRRYTNWESRKDTPLTEELKKLIFGLEGREKGGPVSGGTPYIVGEKGPELFVPMNSGGIVPNHALGGMIRTGKYNYGALGPVASIVAQQALPLAAFMLLPKALEKLGIASEKSNLILNGIFAVMTAGSIYKGVKTAKAAKAAKAAGSVVDDAAETAVATKSVSKFAQSLAKLRLVGMAIPGWGKVAVVALTTLATVSYGAWENARKARLASQEAFDVNEKQAKQLGIAYVSLTDKIKKATDAAQAQSQLTKVKAAGSTAIGGGINMSVKELNALQKKAKETQGDIVSMFNDLDKNDVTKAATALKVQLVAAGKSAQDAAREIYSIISISNKASQATEAVSSTEFLKIVDRASAAKVAIDTFVKSMNASDVDKKEIAASFSGGLDAIQLYYQSLVGVKDASGKAKSQVEALNDTIAHMNANKSNQQDIGDNILNTLIQENPLYKDILNSTDSMVDAWAKIQLYTNGVTADLSDISGEEAQGLLQVVNAISQAATEMTTNANLMNNPIDAIAEYGAAAKKAYDDAKKASDDATKNAQKNADAEIKALDKKIEKINEEADARIRAIEDQAEKQDYLTEVQKEQLNYQQALLSGDMSRAAQSQLNIQSLTNERQKTLSINAIQDKRDAEVKKLEAQKAGVQERLIKLQERANKLQEIANAKQKEYASVQALQQSIATTLSKAAITTDEGTIALLAEALRSDVAALAALGSDGAKAAKTVTSGVPTSKGSTIVTPGGQPIVQPGKQDWVAYLKSLTNDPGGPANSTVEYAKTYFEKFGTHVEDFGLYVKTLTGLDEVNGTRTIPLSKLRGEIKKDPENPNDYNKMEYFTADGKSVGKGAKGRAKYFENPEKPMSGEAYIYPNSKVNRGALNGVQDINLALYNKGVKTPLVQDGLKYEHNGSVTKGGKVVGYWGYNIPNVGFRSYATGGPVKNFEWGGNVKGPGTGTSDSIPAWLSNGEYVIKEKAVKQYGVSFFDGLNAQKLAGGGPVGLGSPSPINSGYLNKGGMIPGFAEGGWLSRFNPLNWFSNAGSAYVTGMQNHGAKKLDYRAPEYKTSLSQSEKNATALEALKEISMYNTAGRIAQGNAGAMDYASIIPFIRPTRAIRSTRNKLEALKLMKQGVHNSPNPNLADELLHPLEYQAQKEQTLGNFTHFSSSPKYQAGNPRYGSNSYKTKLDVKAIMTILKSKGFASSTDMAKKYGLTEGMYGVKFNHPAVQAAMKDGYIGTKYMIGNETAGQFAPFYTGVKNHPLGRIKGFHDGGPVGHKHDSTNVMSAPKWTKLDGKKHYVYDKLSGGFGISVIDTKGMTLDQLNARYIDKGVYTESQSKNKSSSNNSPYSYGPAVGDGLFRGFSVPWLDALGIKGLMQTGNKIFRGGKESEFFGKPNKGDYANAALFPLNFLVGKTKAAKSISKYPLDVAAPSAKMLGSAALRAVQQTPKGILNTLRSVLWKTVGATKVGKEALYKIPKIAGFRPYSPKGVPSVFTNTADYVRRTGKSFFDDITNRPRILPSRTGAPGGAKAWDDWADLSNVGKTNPQEAFGELFGLLSNLTKATTLNPIAKIGSKVKSKITSGIDAKKNSFKFFKEFILPAKSSFNPKQAISNFLYRYTPYGTMKARKILEMGGREGSWSPSAVDPSSGPEMFETLKELSMRPFYHGGILPETLLDRSVPGVLGNAVDDMFAAKHSMFGNLFDFDLFTTASKGMSSSYSKTKNTVNVFSEEAGNIYEMFFKKLTGRKTLDLRGGQKSIWSQSKRAYAALESFLAKTHGMETARLMLAGERIPGQAFSSLGRARDSFLQGENLRLAFTKLGPKGFKYLIDTIVHEGGRNTNSVSHPVVASLAPQKVVSGFKKILDGRDLGFFDSLNLSKVGFTKISSELEKTLTEIVTRAADQKERLGKVLPFLKAGHFAEGGMAGGKFNIPKFETGINNVPADMLAMLHKNEAVVPANMNPFNPNANNATMGGGVYNITNNINGFDGDINALSDMVTRKTVESMKTMSKISVKSMGESRSLGSGLEVRA